MSQTAGYGRVAILAIVATFASSVSAVGQIRECRDEIVPIPAGTIAQNSVQEFEINLHPCQTLSVELQVSTGATRPSGGYFELVNSNGPIEGTRVSWTVPGAQTLTLVNGGWWVPPYRGTRGAYGLPTKARLTSSWSSWSPVNYAGIITKRARPGYNTGGTDFQTAPGTSTGVTYFGSIHYNDPGQFFKVLLRARETFHISGTVLGHNAYGASWDVELFDASFTSVRTMVSGSAKGVDSFSSEAFTNPSSEPATYYLKIKTRWYPVHDFRLNIVPGTTSDITAGGFPGT